MTIELPITDSSGSKTAIEESRRFIDQKKVELYEFIRLLNSRRNELAPVSVLPPELLGRIFNFLVPERDIRRSFDSFESFDSTSWLNFTHVSQTWRNVALDTPTLWNSPDLHCPSWARAMLDRSKMADLVVVADVSLMFKACFLKEVFETHAARIREVNLHGLTELSLASIIENLQPSSLRLRSLRLSTTYEYEDFDPHFPVFPAHLLGEPERLQRLSVVGCSLDWYAQSYPYLTTLAIVNSLVRPLLSELVTALSGMPALEILEMVESLPLATKAEKLNLKVELPRLSSLNLSSKKNLFDVLNILNFLIVPSTARIELSSTSEPNRDTSIGSSLGLFFSCMTGDTEGRSYHRLRLYHHFGGIGLSAWRNEELDDSTGIPSDLPVLSMNLSHPSEQLNQWLDEILSCLSLFDLRTLVIDIFLRQDAILRYFGQSTAIHSLDLGSHASVSNFLLALTHKPDGYEHLESAYYSTFLPALQSISLNSLTFYLDEFLDCLMERYERGAEVQQLVIRNCHDIDDDDVRFVREIVADVDWDESVKYQEYDTDSSDFDMYY